MLILSQVERLEIRNLVTQNDFSGHFFPREWLMIFNENEFKGIVRNNVITVITGVITIIKHVITVITGLFLRIQ